MFGSDDGGVAGDSIQLQMLEQLVSMNGKMEKVEENTKDVAVCEDFGRNPGPNCSKRIYQLNISLFLN